MNPKHPVYIVSKGRWESRLTSKAFEEMRVPYFIVVEEQEYDKYASVISPEKILILDKQYLRDYDTCDLRLAQQGTSAGSTQSPSVHLGIGCWTITLMAFVA